MNLSMAPFRSVDLCISFVAFIAKTETGYFCNIKYTGAYLGYINTFLLDFAQFVL